MSKLLLSVLGIGAVTACLAQMPNAALRNPQAHDRHAPSDLCLLGSDCMDSSKTPAKVCPVKKDAKARDACAVDGMKLVGRYDVEDKI